MKQTNLLPCPCCGSRNVNMDDLRGDDQTVAVFCGDMDCGIRTPNCADEQDAIDTWNTRHTPKRELVVNDKTGE